MERHLQNGIATVLQRPALCCSLNSGCVWGIARAPGWWYHLREPHQHKQAQETSQCSRKVWPKTAVSMVYQIVPQLTMHNSASTGIRPMSQCHPHSRQSCPKHTLIQEPIGAWLWWLHKLQLYRVNAVVLDAPARPYRPHYASRATPRAPGRQGSHTGSQQVAPTAAVPVHTHAAATARSQPI